MKLPEYAVGPPEELILETVWDGRASGPHRGYLAVVPDTPRKAPPPSPEVRRRVGSVSWHPPPPSPETRPGRAPPSNTYCPPTRTSGGRSRPSCDARGMPSRPSGTTWPG